MVKAYTTTVAALPLLLRPDALVFPAPIATPVESAKEQKEVWRRFKFPRLTITRDGLLKGVRRVPDTPSPVDKV